MALRDPVEPIPFGSKMNAALLRVPLHVPVTGAKRQAAQLASPDELNWPTVSNQTHDFRDGVIPKDVVRTQIRRAVFVRLVPFDGFVGFGHPHILPDRASLRGAPNGTSALAGVQRGQAVHGQHISAGLQGYAPVGPAARRRAQARPGGKSSQHEHLVIVGADCLRE